jgi:hypothetical protein
MTNYKRSCPRKRSIDQTTDLYLQIEDYIHQVLGDSWGTVEDLVTLYALLKAPIEQKLDRSEQLC